MPRLPSFFVIVLVLGLLRILPLLRASARQGSRSSRSNGLRQDGEALADEPQDGILLVGPIERVHDEGLMVLGDDVGAHHLLSRGELVGHVGPAIQHHAVVDGLDHEGQAEDTSVAVAAEVVDGLRLLQGGDVSGTEATVKKERC